MRILQVKLDNFLSFGKNTEINLRGFNLIVGPNGAGKTNFLRAVDYVGVCLRRQQYEPQHEYYFAGTQDLKIEVLVQLSEDERGALADYLALSSLAESPKADSGENQEKVRQEGFQTAMKLREGLAQALAKVSILIIGRGNESEHPKKFLRLASSRKDFYISEGSYLSVETERESSDFWLANFLVDSAQEVGLSSRKLLDHLSSKLSEIHPQSIRFADSIRFDVMERRKGAEAVTRRLRDFMRNRGSYEDYADFFGVLNAIYNGSIVLVSELRCKPDPFTVWQGTTSTPIIGRELNGRNLNAMLFQLKNSIHSSERDRFRSVRDAFRSLISNSFDVEVVERTRTEKKSPVMPPINPSAWTEVSSNEVAEMETIHEVATQIYDGNQWINLSFSAAGIFELLVLLTAFIGHTNKVLMLDEPALNLHPTKQIELREMLEKSVKDSGHQVIVVTHSPALVTTEHACDTLRFVRGSEGTSFVQIASILDKWGSLKKHLGGGMSELDWAQILFASGAVFVEGVEDKYAVERFDRHMGGGGAQLLDDNWPVVSVGRDSFPKFMELCQELGIHYAVLTDRDGVMYCKDSVESRPCPGVFASLFRKNIFAQEDKSRLLSVQIRQNSKGQWCYEDEEFPTIKILAKKYGIFPFSSDLEGGLGIPKKGRSGFKNVLEAVDAKLPSPPEEITEFFKFVRELKIRKRN